MKKSMIALMLALVMLLAGCAVHATGMDGSSFTDVQEDAFYFDAVNWAVENDITQGMGGGLFQPDGICNRAQAVTFLWRLEGKPVCSGESAFSDVQNGSWYADAVAWAVSRNITNGMGGDIFAPNSTCNRAQIVTFLWRYAGMPDANGDNPFNDVPDGKWYAEAVAWAVEKGITKGLTETTFGPDEPCNRSQIVTFLHRYAISVAEPPAPEPSVPDWEMGDEDL